MQARVLLDQPRVSNRAPFVQRRNQKKAVESEIASIRTKIPLENCQRPLTPRGLLLQPYIAEDLRESPFSMERSWKMAKAEQRNVTRSDYNRSTLNSEPSRAPRASTSLVDDRLVRLHFIRFPSFHLRFDRLPVRFQRIQNEA